MAQLRYQSVAAPNFSGVAQMLANSSSGFSRGFDKLSATLGGLADERKQEAIASQSNALIPELAKVASEGGVNDFLSSLNGRIDPKNMSPELLKAIQNLRGNAQGYDQNRLNQSKTSADIRGIDARTRGTDAVTAGTRANTQIALNADGRAQTQFDRGIAKQDALGNLTNTFADARINAYNGENNLATLGSNPKAKAIVDGLVRRGLPQHVAEGFAVNIGDESNFDAGVNEKNPTVKGSRGGFGLYQLTGDRRVAYEKYAKDRGINPSDPDAQLDYLVQELKTSEKGAASSILNSRNSSDAAIAVASKFLRPAKENLQRRVAKYSGGIDFSQGGVLTPSDINPLIDQTYKSFGIGQDRRNTDAVNADANRSRDTAFNNAETARRDASAGLAAAIDRANTSLNPTEAVQQIASDPNLSPEAKQAALTQLGNLPVDTIQAPAPGSQPAAFPESGQANVIIDSFVKEQQAALANNDNIRINKNATEAYSDGSPANKLLERIPGLNANNATVLTAINKVREALPAGASPALAASLIEETVRQGRSFIPFDGEDSSTVEIDTDAAIAKGKEILSPEGVRNAAEVTAQAENNKTGIDKIQQAITGLQGQITREEQLGRDSSASRQLLQNYNERLRTFQRDNPVVGQTNRAVEQQAAPQGQQVPVSQNPQERKAASDYLRSQPELVQQLQNWGNFTDAQKAAVIQQMTQKVLNERLMTTNQKRAVIGELNALRAGN